MSITKSIMTNTVLSREFSAGAEYQKKRIALRILRTEFDKNQEPHIYKILNRVRKCNNPYRCNSHWCPTCSNPRASKSKRKKVNSATLPPENFAGPTTTNAKSSEYRVRGGQRMISVFNNLPLVMCHPVTINIALIPINGCIKKVVDRIRKRFHLFLSQLNHGAICRGKFDIVLKWLDELTFTIPHSEWPAGVNPNNPPHERYAMLHFHGVIFDPYLTHRELRQLLVDEFEGAKRVCVRQAHKIALLDDGTLCGGLQGYLEYTSMEKIEADFGDESADAILEYAKIDSTWKRANHNLSYGKSVEVSGLIIDPKVQASLERKRRLDNVKSNWSNMGYACRFFYQWFSHATEMLSLISDRFANRSDIRNRINQIYEYNCNWVKSTCFEIIEFKEFFMLERSKLAENLAKLVPI